MTELSRVAWTVILLVALVLLADSAYLVLRGRTFLGVELIVGGAIALVVLALALRMMPHDRRPRG